MAFYCSDSNASQSLAFSSMLAGFFMLTKGKQTPLYFIEGPRSSLKLVNFRSFDRDCFIVSVEYQENVDRP